MRALVAAAVLLALVAPASAQDPAILVDTPRTVEAGCDGVATLRSLTTIVVLSELRATLPDSCLTDPAADRAPNGASLVLEAPMIVFHDGAMLAAGDGRPGLARSATDATGNVTAQAGGHGGWVRLLGEVRADGGLIQPGAGGAGGGIEATTKAGATAWGGGGGDAGQVELQGANVLAPGGLQLVVPDIRPALGGRGGSAVVRGLATGGAGGNVTAVGGPGGASWGLEGEVPPGARGGDAKANAAPGSAGHALQMDGQDGGSAIAVSGHGGPGSAWGLAGNATAVAGRGGRGLDAGTRGQDPCITTGTAGHGGRGGMALARAGAGEFDQANRDLAYAQAGHGGDGGTSWGEGGVGGEGGRGGFADGKIHGPPIDGVLVVAWFVPVYVGTWGVAGPTTVLAGEGGDGGDAVWRPGDGGRGGDASGHRSSVALAGPGGEAGSRLAPCPPDEPLQGDGHRYEPERAMDGQDGEVRTAPAAAAPLLLALLGGLVAWRARPRGKP